MLCYAIGINYSSWAMVNVIFNSYIKSKAFAWWAKYNYILAAALDFGTAFAGIIIFFAVSYPGMFSSSFHFSIAWIVRNVLIIDSFCLSRVGYSFPDWWGNNVYLNTADGRGEAWKAMPEVGYFGPANGTWS